MQSINPSLRYVCDPVLGDDGRCYVPESLVALYRSVDDPPGGWADSLRSGLPVADSLPLPPPRTARMSFLWPTS